MRDALGSKLKEGDFVFWRQSGMVYKVVRVDDSLIASPRSGTRPDARLVLELGLPISTEGLRYDQEPQLPDLFCLRNPQSDKLIDDDLTGRPPQ